MSQETRGGEAGLADVFAGRFSLRHPAVRAAVLNAGSFGASQVLRFASNLILTRLLVPEAFGLMLMVNLVLQGLEMFSDLGLSPSLIQHPRGEEPKFLRTAWTLGLLRGAVLWTLALLIAWPVAAFYGEPQLTAVLPVVALTIIIDAFCSAQVCVLQRHLVFGRLIFIDLFSYVLMVAVMITGAFYSQTVWPLVIGSIVGSTVSTALTHVMLGGPRMGFTFDRDVVRALFRFGKWLFISSILTFLAGQLDRIVLGKFMTMAELGVYSIAFMLSQMMVYLVSDLSRQILFPVYARAAELGPQHLRRQVTRYRLALFAMSVPPLACLVFIAPELIRFLYDERYWEAGWMLQVLGAGATFPVILSPIESVLMASGDSFRHMVMQFWRSVVMLGAMGYGGWYYGANGVIFGFAVSGLLQYPFLAALVRRHGIWIPLLDLALYGLSAAALAAGLWLRAHLG